MGSDITSDWISSPTDRTSVSKSITAGNKGKAKISKQ